MRYSKQREMVLQAVTEHPIHPTADEVYKMVRSIEPNISLGTVYRNLNQLADAGELLRLPVANDKDRYDGNVLRHYHLLCQSCGRLYDLPKELSEQIEALSKKINDIAQVKVNPEHIQFEGICRECLAKSSLNKSTESQKIS